MKHKCKKERVLRGWFAEASYGKDISDKEINKLFREFDKIDKK